MEDLSDWRASLQAALEQGDGRAAFDMCEERLKLAPDDADIHRYFSVIYASAGEGPRAIALGERACTLAPDDPRCWSDLGRVHGMMRNMPAAVTALSKAVQIDDRYADAWHNLGVAQRQIGRRDIAFSAFKKALLIDGKRAETYVELGTLLIDAGQVRDAVECFDRAVKIEPTTAAARSRLGTRVLDDGKVAQAESLFRQSLSMDPNHVEGWIGLGNALEDIGQAEGALVAYVNALRRRPDSATALYRYLALLKDTTDIGIGSESDDVRIWLHQAEKIVASSDVQDEARALVGYGLAKYRDRTGDPRAAANAGQQANAARTRVAGRFDRAMFTEWVDCLIATCTPEFFASRKSWGNADARPVFIVGLPRSGTSLTEQIIDAHPELRGAGELPDIARLCAGAAGDDAPWLGAMKIDSTTGPQAAEKYLAALGQRAPGDALRVSDKAPLNFLHLAFAAQLFPNARVIHCCRNIRDNALSIWLENFSPDQQYASGFEDLAFFVAEYQRLMEHWRAALPLPILDVTYEDTVADVEQQARRMMAFLDVRWDERCLAFHKNSRAVQTPSRWQVRQAIYDRSVGRWKSYADHLPELIAAFP